MTILSQAPARVDLAGGTLDIWPLYLFHENSQTINFAIRCYARCRLTPRRDGVIELVSRDLGRRESFPSLDTLRQGKRFLLPLPARLTLALAPSRGFTLETDSDVPAGSGLGGSSALNIAICGALVKYTGARLPGINVPQRMIELARNVEAQVLGVPTGEQDYYSAMFGGVQAIHLRPHGIQPERLKIAAGEIESRFVLCYTGESRNSGINNWEVQKAHIDGSARVRRHFASIAAIAGEMRRALAAQDWKATAKLLNREWTARKKNHPGITTPTIEKLLALARRQGALAGKACGAGGGGCVAFLVKDGAKRRIEEALEAAGAGILSSRLASQGLVVKTV
jgi:D-glycero-alpha-D-manno-heptose-7-phosphate kinase